MAIPNFAKPAGSAPVQGQDTLSSGSGTVQQQGWDPRRWMQNLRAGARPTQQPQQNAKPINSPAPGMQSEAQQNAQRRLPPPNNGNPGGANNMPVLPNFEDQPVDNARLAEMIRQYNTEWRRQNVDPYSLDRYAPPIRSTEANQRMVDYFSNQLRQGDPRNPLNTQGTGYQGNQGQGYRPMPIYAPMGGDPNYFGGQSPGAGRYRPPTQDGRGNWNDYGGYNYNLPNAFGSYPGYGQGNPYSWMQGPGMEGMYGYMPQFNWGGG